jgi:hypothetical protein
MLDQGGLSARMIADQLGHSRISMTQMSTWGGVPMMARASALEGLFDQDGPDDEDPGSGPLAVVS